MSNKEARETFVSPSEEKKSFTSKLKSMSVRWKIRVACLVGIILTACFVILMVNRFQRKASIRNAYEKVYLLRSVKTRLAEAYFDRLSERIKNFASDPKTLDMQSRFSESFLNIENDQYSTAGAETPDKINALLDGYYSNEILPSLESGMDKKINYSSIVSDDHRQQIMQYLYIAGNPRPIGSKHLLSRASDGSTYSNIHSQIHPAMMKYMRDAGISDMLLVDYKSGYVVYSVKKNLDFATSLYEGPFKNSALGIAFKSAIGLPSSEMVQFTDESIYVPAMLKPVLFVSAPLYSGLEIKGAVIFAVDAAALDGLLAPVDDEMTVAPVLKSFFVGSDLLYRNNDPEMAASREHYIRRLKKFAGDGSAYRKAAKLNTTALVQRVDELVFAQGKQGKEQLAEYTTATGQRMLCSCGPVNIPGLNWMLVCQIERSRALMPVRNLTWFMAGITLLIVILSYLVVYNLSDSLAKRFGGLGDFLQSLAQGGGHDNQKEMQGDEIDRSVLAASQLTSRINQASLFIDDLGRGNIDQEFLQLGREDKLGLALNILKKNLVIRRDEETVRKKEEEIRNWSAQGIALFNDILRTDNDNLEKLSLNIIRNIIQYLSANQGGIFLINEEDEVKYLDLVAAYAFDRQKFLKKRIGIGEGLTGTCVLEKKTILLSRIPENYIEITSGLGGARPGCLLIVPLKKEEEILGVMEIASFQPFQPHEVEFVEKVAESIASALITVRLHLQTSQYLERFQQQAEEMKAQDEELRQNIEELQATHEQMERMKEEENAHNLKMMKEIEDSRKLLIDILDKIPAKIFLKDDKGVFVVVNSAVAEVYNKPVEQVIGTTDYDNHPDEDVDSWRKQELEIMEKGETTYIHSETAHGVTRHLKTIKMPLRIATTGKTGLLGIQLDITDFTLIEQENKEKEKQLELNQQLLIDILNKIPAKIFLKDEKGVFVVVNNAVADVYNKPVEQVIGTTDYDNHPDEDVDSWRKQELEIMEKGETTYIHTETSHEVTRYLKTIKMPLQVATTGNTGLLGIQLDVTDLKLLEAQVVKLNSEVAKLKKK
jgi:PAS domain S-box-containing protein